MSNYEDRITKVRLRDICDLDFSPGKPLSTVQIEGREEEGLFAAHEIDIIQKVMRGRLLSRRALFGLGFFGAAGLLLRPELVLAANRTAWTAGNGVGFTWTALFSSSAATDINNASGIANGSCVLSTITISNQTALDIFMDISARFAISSSTVAAGANLSFYLYGLLDDGTTYGSGELTAGTVAATQPPIPPNAIVPLRAAATQTALVGFYQGAVMPPGTFKEVFQNNSGFTTATTGNVCMYRTYNTNLNN